ncbi:MAG: transcriptional regulator [Ancalomicrobiaceae bacterium]|nr:transcriptional regulator [Ancalomicrobiaceae bacterium]
MTAPFPISTRPEAIECLECGLPVNNPLAHGFCSTRCRKAWNNRRMVRGAEFYDLLMALWCERGAAKKAHVFGLIWRIAKRLRQEDVDQRAGRRSWQPLRVGLARRAVLCATAPIESEKGLS